MFDYATLHTRYDGAARDFQLREATLSGALQDTKETLMLASADELANGFLAGKVTERAFALHALTQRFTPVLTAHVRYCGCSYALMQSTSEYAPQYAVEREYAARALTFELETFENFLYSGGSLRERLHVASTARPAWAQGQNAHLLTS